MSTPDIDELFAQALCGDYEDDSPWQAVHALQQIGTREVFERAAKWCDSDDPLRRARGVQVLAQLGRTLGHRSNSFPEDSYSVIAGLVQRETEARPLASAITALGHMDNPVAVPLIAGFHSHESADVRFDVAFALGCFPNHALSVSILLKLMRDADEDVRDWATFGLGVQGNCDSAEIREALLGRLSDDNEDVREEAMVGLAKRRDQRVLSILLPALEQPTISVRVIEAAYLLLGMQSEQEGWNKLDYCAALRERFSPG